MPCTNHPVVNENVVNCSRCSKPFCQDCVVQLKSNYYCIDCKGEQVKDIQSGADTTQLDLAGVGTRLAARILDGLIIGIPLYAIIFLGLGAAMSTGANNPTIGMSFILIMLVALFVPLLYEAVMLSMRGQTLGKMICKIKVVTPEGNDISGGQAWGRTIIHVLLAGLLGWIGALINLIFIFQAERACLHDKIAKTRVVNWRQ
jgi:uncharacterized RDD family membrane protein YckC